MFTVIAECNGIWYMSSNTVVKEFLFRKAFKIYRAIGQLHRLLHLGNHLNNEWTVVFGNTVEEKKFIIIMRGMN